MDPLDEVENWKIGGAVCIFIAVIGSLAYFGGGGTSPDTQTYIMQGELVRPHYASDAAEAEKLWVTDTGSCDDSIVGESNLTTNQIEMPFTVEDRVKEEGNYDSPFNYVSICLETNYGEVKGHADTLRSLKERGGLITDHGRFMPDKIRFMTVEGHSVYEIRNFELKVTKE